MQMNEQGVKGFKFCNYLNGASHQKCNLQASHRFITVMIPRNFYRLISFGAKAQSINIQRQV